LKLETALCFDDVLIVPQYSEIESRRDIDISTRIGDKKLEIPIISSPMDTVTGGNMAAAMSKSGGVGIIHRYNTPDEQADTVRSALASGAENIGVAIGVTEEAVYRAQKCIQAGASIICIDVAHGHHVLMRHALTVLRNTFGSDVHIMAGNVATPEAYCDLAEWGADSVRVGIGGGSICSTRIQTGHGMPTLQSVFDCASAGIDIPIIADGGIRNSGDIVKCLAAGADAVMLGSLLAGADESPGDVTVQDGQKIKVYRGMASKDAQMNWRGHYASVEGVTSFVKSSGPLSLTLGDLERGIRSGLSYSGCSSLIDLWARSKFIRQTAMGTRESDTHILGR
jgi:IMP dehydrogenase